MYLRPCRNCPHKDGCEMKAEWQNKLYGLGLTLVNFKCEKRLSLLQPGQRIGLVFKDPSDDCLYPYENFAYGVHEELDQTATVMRARGTRILVWLDEMTPVGRNPVAVSPDRVTPIDGTVELCSECGQPNGTKADERRANGSMGFYCGKCQGGPAPNDDWLEGEPY